ncbi:MAG: hypothetical protein GY898_25515 [Proteobacteria bacterium]|nr:hypothetical protein [Pseudomonadota bacterium]
MSVSSDPLLDDLPRPAWWLGIFYASIAFTFVYIPWLYAASWDQVNSYEAEMTVEEAQWPTSEVVE